MTAPGPVYHLALRDLHREAGASFRLVDGWSVPAGYGDAASEYAALRESAVVADRSDRSRFMVTGTDAGTVLDAAFAGHLNELEEGRAVRTLALDGRGEIRDVVLVARTGGIAYLVSGEPSRREETLTRLNDQVRADFDVRIEDRTATTCMLTLAGPGAASVAAAHLSDALPARLPSLHCATFEFHGFRTLAVRAGEGGEDGFCFVVAPAVAQHLLETLQAAGVTLAGRDALECARVEACIPAAEPDLAGLTPAEAGAERGATPRRVLSALLLDATDPVASSTPLTHDGGLAGDVRSCVRSFSLRSAIALAVVEADCSSPGTQLDAGAIRGTIVAQPIYRRRQ